MVRAIPAIFLAALAALASAGHLRQQTQSLRLDGASRAMDLPGLDAWLGQGGILLDFTSATVTDNNLGGFGPASGVQRITYENVGTYEGQQLDLQIVADSGYVPNNSTNNGKASAYFGQINLKKGKSSVMQFTVVGHDTEKPVVLPSTAITIWDFDMGSSPGKLTEMATISPYAGYFIMSDSLVNVVNGEDSVYFESTVYGNEADNPASPNNLTETQKHKVVAVTFEQVSTWNITFAVNKSGSGGRNFLFSGHVPNISYTPDPCRSYTSVSFSYASVEYSNLGGGGPNTGSPRGIKYTNVTTAKGGKQVDLLVRADLTDYSAYEPMKNGKSGNLGNINLSPGISTRLNFTFQNVAGEPVELERFFFTFFDIDMTPQGAAEILQMNSADADDASGFEDYYLSNHTTLEVDSTNPKFKFTATKGSTEKTNPRDAFNIDELQASESVAFWFEHKRSTFAVDYSASPESFAGRNLLFGGESAIGCPALR